jgi:hypothetical protein
MGYTLRLTFGGLCLLVEETKGGAGADVGFYAVLPKSAPMPHIATIFYRERYAGGTSDDWIKQQLTDRIVDLKGLIVPGKGGWPVPKRFLRVSAHAKAGIDPKHLGATSNDVQALIKLPLLQRPIEPYGDLARVQVACETPCADWVAGLARVEYDVSNSDPFTIGGKALTPKNGILEVVIANLAATASSPSPSSEKPGVGSEVRHVHAYFPLLKPRARTLPSTDAAGRAEETGPVVVEPRPDDGEEAMSDRAMRGASRGRNDLEAMATSMPAADAAPRYFVHTPSADDPWITIGVSVADARLTATPGYAEWIIPEECTVGVADPPSA